MLDSSLRLTDRSSERRDEEEQKENNGFREEGPQRPETGAGAIPTYSLVRDTRGFLRSGWRGKREEPAKKEKDNRKNTNEHSRKLQKEERRRAGAGEMSDVLNQGAKPRKKGEGVAAACKTRGGDAAKSWNRRYKKNCPKREKSFF